jgi:hypothetical protein
MRWLFHLYKTMTAYDLFNGDADGICSLQQLRLHSPLEAQLITGLKRDINLFSQIQAQAGDKITALDISFDKNREGVQAALDVGASVFYADHHFAGELIESDALDLHIHTDTDTCTSLIINALLKDRYYGWALAGCYGDNLYDSANKLADRMQVDSDDREALKLLGTVINYNGYGFTLDDLIYHPAELYRLLQAFENPLDFIQTEHYRSLLDAYQHDLKSTHELTALHEKDNGAIFVLPNEAWARRVNGVFSNDLARDYTARAHAVLVKFSEDSYRVSVRAPLDNKIGADELCRQFEGGGGRKAAAGINELPESELDRFNELFFDSFRVG